MRRRLRQPGRRLRMQVQSQVVAVTNRLSSTVEASLRPGSSDRYTVHPQQLRLRPGQTAEVELKLKVTRFAQAEKAVEHGHRDLLHVKTPYFDQKFPVTFFLSRSVLKAGAPHASRRHDAYVPPASVAAEGEDDAAERSQTAPAADEPSSRALLRFAIPSSPAGLPPRGRSLDSQVTPAHSQAALRAVPARFVSMTRTRE